MPKDNFSSFFLKIALFMSTASADKSFVKNFLEKLSPLACFGVADLRLVRSRLQGTGFYCLHDEVFLQYALLEVFVKAQNIGKSLEVLGEKWVGASDDDAVTAQVESLANGIDLLVEDCDVRVVVARGSKRRHY